MAGVKGRSGGKRKGSGRKPLPPEQLNTETPISVVDISPSVDDMPFVAIPSANETVDKELLLNPIEDMKQLKCPIEFETMPFAKQAWEYVLELDKESNLLTARQFENLKSYCLSIEIRQNLIAEWERQEKVATITTRNGELRVNPVLNEILKQSDRISAFASDLGLTIMGGFKVAKEKQSSPKLNNKEKKDDLFN